MTELLHNVEAPSDAELISRVRGGDVAAYGDLFSRHVAAANRLARQLVRGPDADDLVAEAFAKVLSVLQGGGGPDVAFRAYLLTAVRRLHVDRVRAGSKLQTTDDLSAFDPGIPFQDTAVEGFESGAAAKAFASLPERWQLVLWHLEVEGQKPADIAPLLGMSPNSVSALAYRAREGLRQAFLTMHLSDISETDCRWVNEHLGAYVRNGLSKRDTGKVQAHLDQCRRCTAMYLELTEVNSNLSGIIAPLLLGGAATAYLSSTGGIGTGGLLALMGRARDTVAANATAATAGAVAVGVAAAAVVGITLAIGKSHEPVSGADRPIGTVTTGPAVPGTQSPSARRSSGGPAAKGSAGPTAGPAAGTYPGALGTPAPAATLGAPGDTASAGDQPGGQGSQPGDGGQPGGGSSHGGNPTPTPTPTATPTQTPTSGPATVNVHVGVQISEASASVTVSGQAGVPPTFDVSLTADPGGITFQDTAACPVVSRTTTTARAHCTNLGSVGGSARVPGTAAAVLDGPVTATLPFKYDARQPDSTVSVSVLLPDGFADPDGSADLTASRPYTAPKAALAMGDLTPADPGSAVGTSSALPSKEDGNYHLSGTVTGIPDSLDSITLVSGGASFVDAPAGCGFLDDHHRIACPTSGESLPLTFALTPDGALPAPVSITAVLPDRYVDTSPFGINDNSATATLDPPAPRLPSADVSVTQPSPNPVPAEKDGTYRLTVQASGFPADSPPATYTLTGGATIVGGTQGSGCDLLGAALVCQQPSDGPVQLVVRADDPTRDTTGVRVHVDPLTGYDDPDQANNTTSDPVTLTAVTAEKPTADLSLTLPGTTHEDGNDPTANTFTLDATVAGLPDGVTSVTLTQRGAERFAGGCEGDATTVTCTVDGAGQVHPKVSYTGTTQQDVTLSAQTPAGYVDPTPEQPASAATTLEPEAANALQATAELTMGDQNDGALAVTVTGAATGKPLTLTLADKNGHLNGVKFLSDADCVRADDHTVITCPGGDSPVTLTVDVFVPSGLTAATVTVTDGVHEPREATFDRPKETGHDAVRPAGAVSNAVPHRTLARQKAPAHRAHPTHRARHGDQVRRTATPRTIAETIGNGIRSLLGPPRR